MPEIAERYRALAAEVTRRVRAVPADGWEADSPCEGWTARDVLRHLVEVQSRPPRMGGLSAESFEAGVDDDPLGAWEAAHTQLQEALDDPEKANIEFEGLAGRTSVAKATDLFVCTDLLLHGWDLARATGQDETLPADEVTLVHEKSQAFAPMLRQPGVCGPEVIVPADAPAQHRLLGLFGRTP